MTENVYKVRTTIDKSTMKTVKVIQAEIVGEPSRLTPCITYRMSDRLKAATAQTKRAAGRLSNSE
jgi:hypothetical protein